MEIVSIIIDREYTIKEVMNAVAFVVEQACQPIVIIPPEFKTTYTELFDILKSIHIPVSPKIGFDIRTIRPSDVHSNVMIKDWGYYRTYSSHQSSSSQSAKVKIIVVEPHKMLSMQRHHYRSEFWFVSSGQPSLYTLGKIGQEYYRILSKTLDEHEHVFIPKGEWHQLVNDTDKEVRVIEIQYGSKTDEDDIERKSF